MVVKTTLEDLPDGGNGRGTQLRIPMFDDTDAINEISVFQPKSMAKFHRTRYLDTKEKPPKHLRAKALLQIQVGFHMDAFMMMGVLAFHQLC